MSGLQRYATAARASSMQERNDEISRIREINTLVQIHGREAARQIVNRDEGILVDRAHNYLSDESGISMTYSGFCVLAFPHRAPADDGEICLRTNGKFSLLIEPGAITKNGQVRRVGVPYGARARIIMLYLQTEALKNNSPTIEIGRSMNNWLDKMGISIGGKTYRQVREQALRISRCKLTFQLNEQDDKGHHWQGFENDGIVKKGMAFAMDLGADIRQSTLWDETIRLTDTFFAKLQEHPVPIEESAIRAIVHQSLSIDIYTWLAYRLRYLQQPVPVSWEDLKEQFGPNYTRLRAFRDKFIESLKNVLVVYPKAVVNVTERGLTLFPSPPPVPEKKPRRLSVVSTESPLPSITSDVEAD